MKRKIKFRGWQDNQWIYGLLEKDHKTGIYYIRPEYAINNCAVEQDSIGQFTGLKDADGKEIYDGDILFQEENEYFEDIVAIVFWQKDQAGWFVANSKGACPLGDFLHYYDQCKVQNLEFKFG